LSLHQCGCRLLDSHVRSRIRSSTKPPALFAVRQYTFYDWTREMPKATPLATWSGITIQGYAVFSRGRSLFWLHLSTHDCAVQGVTLRRQERCVNEVA
jgi:hypothetical protein